ncbi:type IV secretory system conjugative DNA transfer family protein [Kineococcus sp. SYSU DK005]|uniref:type IV secretory system conjugative DNA transfer family protein n=1 Tax=Kineococcus sp. SYSU DK005 TaxID=3383126 RepID=UPI003D7D17CE
MSQQWGPQGSALAPAPSQASGRGWHWKVYALAVLVAAPWTYAHVHAGQYWQAPFLAVIALTSLVGLALGLHDGASRAAFARGRWLCALIVLIGAAPSFLAYAAAFVFGRSSSTGQDLAGQSATPGRAGGAGGAVKPGRSVAPEGLIHRLSRAADPLQVLRQAAAANALPGGHLGWSADAKKQLGAASPRGGLLVIGPPGSGKSSAALIPSIWLAPGVCVASSIKGDLMEATATARAGMGRVWHFDPGGQEQPAPGVVPARWSPLVSVHSWEDARRVATRMALPMRSQGEGEHFVDRARDWLEVLLWAASLVRLPIGTVADWAISADTEETSTTVLSVLEAAAQDGYEAASIARAQLVGLLGLPDRERSSVLSTLVRLVRVYNAPAARRSGETPNFDPAAFVRSTDTLYLTASPDRQAEYAPILVGLLEELRSATYARHAAEAAQREPKRAHVTFVLDEANNTAPIPLPAIISEAGGQSLHIIVGIQDLSRARARWGQEADGFLTLFPTKLVFPGVIEPYTVDALSSAAGEFDRIHLSQSQSTMMVKNKAVTVTNPSTSIARQKVLTPGDIANVPKGQVLHWQGGAWTLQNVGFHWEDRIWTTLTAAAGMKQGERK